METSTAARKLCAEKYGDDDKEAERTQQHAV